METTDIYNKCLLSTGVLGMVFYAVFAGAPIIIVGFLGVAIQKRIPRVYSFSDYVQRVGPTSRLLRGEVLRSSFRHYFLKTLCWGGVLATLTVELEGKVSLNCMRVPLSVHRITSICKLKVYCCTLLYSRKSMARLI